MRFIFLLVLILIAVYLPYAAVQAAGGANWICASTPPASPIGTTIGPAISITDYNGVVWTVQGGAVYADGLPACTSSKTALLLYYYGKIYKQNEAKAWAVWMGRVVNMYLLIRALLGSSLCHPPIRRQRQALLLMSSLLARCAMVLLTIQQRFKPLSI